MKIYPNIRNLREDHDLTQSELARELNTSQRTYSRYENGQHNIPTEILIELADYYSVSVDYLLGLTPHKDPYPPRHAREKASLTKETKEKNK